LDATLPKSRVNTQGCPHPSQCQLLHVNRDTLFSFHPVSEKFLQQMMALYVASHYKNSPNDLQLMSDAPAHQLFALVPPIDDEATRLPEPLCVIQVALEGRISRQSVLNSLSRGQRAGGDLIPWVVSQQFQDSEFAGLSGSRIVRIATNPDYLNMGYGSRALQLLTDFYEGKFTDLSENDDTTIQETEAMSRVTDAELESTSLLEDTIKIRDIQAMPPLFSKLSERRPDPLDYLGVSFGLTSPLHKFWKRALFAPVYLRQTPNDLTGEHSCVMLRPLHTNGENDTSWLSAYASDFHKRFLTLLSYQFRTFPSIQSLSMSESATKTTSNTKSGLPAPNAPTPLTATDLESAFSPFDLARLDSYANNMLDYHVILDLLPQIAMFYFTGRLQSSVSLSGVQQAILLSIGLQRKVLEDVEKELGVPASQLLAMFVKVVRKVSSYFRALKEDAVAEKLPGKNVEAGSEVERDGMDVDQTSPADPDADTLAKDSHTKKKSKPFEPLAQSLSDELAEGGREVDREMKEKQRALVDALPLDR
jgi:N-acetyltransferase 10